MNTDKFSDKAEVYEKYRPDYPKEFIDYLYSVVGFSEDSIISDIGSGTGIFSKQLLLRGSKVICVEPNLSMRQTAEKNLYSFFNFTSVNGTDENTNLQDKSIDFVTVAQAFHWFKAEKFKNECQRILKPNGKVVLVWNSRIPESELVRESWVLSKELCPDFKGFSGGYEENPESFSLFFRDGIFEYKSFKNDIQFTKEGFIGRNLSASYAPKEKDLNYKKFVDGLSELFDRYNNNGILLMPNITRCYIGKI